MRAYLECIVLNEQHHYVGEGDAEFVIYSDVIKMRMPDNTFVSFKTDELHALTVMSMSLAESYRKSKVKI